MLDRHLVAAAEMARIEPLDLDRVTPSLESLDIDLHGARRAPGVVPALDDQHRRTDVVDVRQRRPCPHRFPLLVGATLKSIRS